LRSNARYLPRAKLRFACCVALIPASLSGCDAFSEPEVDCALRVTFEGRNYRPQPSEQGVPVGNRVGTALLPEAQRHCALTQREPAYEISGVDPSDGFFAAQTVYVSEDFGSPEEMPRLLRELRR
jgi:hypothetical protein